MPLEPSPSPVHGVPTIARWMAGFACAILIISYVALAVDARRVWIWSAIVHEDGARTFADTVLYYAHAVRELPLDLLLGAAVAAAMPPRPTVRRWRMVGVVVVGLTVSVALAGAILSGGIGDALNNLAQRPTRPGSPLAWGAHWRSHLLSRLALILMAYGALSLVPAARPRRPFAMALVVFALLSLLFGIDERPFVDPILLGHQARELMTHTLVTLPLAVAALLALTQQSLLPHRWKHSLAGMLPAILLGGYLALGVLLTSSRAHAQTDSLVVLVFAHFFEHSFGFVLVPATAVACYCGEPAR